MLRPNNPLRATHDLLSLFVLMADLAITPYALAWAVPFIGAYKYICMISGAFWLVDILLNFITGYYLHGELVTAPRKVVLRYLRSWFFLDIIVVGVDWMSMIVMQGGKTWKLLRFAKLGRLLRILTMLRLLRIFQIGEQMFEEVMTNFSEGAKVSVTFLGLVLIVFSLSHVATCALWSLGRSTVTDTGMTWLIDGELGLDKHGAVYQYATAFHWSIAALTLGNMEITCKNSAERMFSIVCLVLGLLLGCTLISSVSATLVGFQVAKKEVTQQRRKLQRFMRENRVPMDVSHPIQQQATERLRLRKRVLFQDVEAIALLSASLRSKLCFEVFRPQLVQHPLFRFWNDTANSTLQRFCTAEVETMPHRNDDELFIAGPEVAKQVYLLVEGAIKYIQEPGSSVVDSHSATTVEKGQWLSEAAFWTKWHHVGTAQAITLCSVLHMECEGLVELLRKRGAVGHIVKQYGREFHRCIVTAKPPEAQWPDDLSVPLTGFEDIVMSFDVDTQKAFSRYAIQHHSSHVSGNKNKRLSYFSKQRSRLEKEILSGKSVVTLDPEGCLQRVARVCVVRLQRGVDHAELVQLGKRGGSLHVGVKLPATKLQPWESPKDALMRLLGTKLQPLGINAGVVSTDYEVSWQDSKEFGLRSKYLRTVVSMSFDSMAENRTCRIDQARLGKARQIRHPSESFLEKEVYFVSDADRNLHFFAWLQSHEVDYLNGAGMGFLEEWVAALVPSSRWSFRAESESVLDLSLLQDNSEGAEDSVDAASESLDPEAGQSH